MFACITVVLAIGGFAERGRIGPVLLFMFCWLTIVYCPIGEWGSQISRQETDPETVSSMLDMERRWLEFRSGWS